MINKGTGVAKTVCGGEKVTTSNRMELTAAIAALESLKRACEITLVSDSTYVTEGASKWIIGWKKNGWRRSKTKEIINVDLWIRLDAAICKFPHKITWEWTRSHVGTAGNELADRLAEQGRVSQITTSQPLENSTIYIENR